MACQRIFEGAGVLALSLDGGTIAGIATMAGIGTGVGGTGIGAGGIGTGAGATGTGGTTAGIIVTGAGDRGLTAAAGPPCGPVLHRAELALRKAGEPCKGELR